MSASNRMLNLVFHDGVDCRRQWPRQRMLLTARLITVTGEHRICIRDLSPGGARVEGCDLPPVASDVLVKRGRFEAFGTIAWNSEGHAGIEFDEPIDYKAFETLQQPAEVAPGADQVALSGKRPGFGRKSAQPEKPRFAHGWGWLDV